jgi:hypothetical protein
MTDNIDPTTVLGNNNTSGGTPTTAILVIALLATQCVLMAFTIAKDFYLGRKRLELKRRELEHPTENSAPRIKINISPNHSPTHSRRPSHSQLVTDLAATVEKTHN